MLYVVVWKGDVRPEDYCIRMLESEENDILMLSALRPNNDLIRASKSEISEIWEYEAFLSKRSHLNIVHLPVLKRH